MTGHNLMKLGRNVPYQILTKYYGYKKKSLNMVIICTNINKMNNHLSSELNSLNTTNTTTYDVGDPGPGLGQAQK